MAASNASTLVFSVVFGVAVFEETITKASGAAPAWIGLALAVVGVIVLASGASTRHDARQA